MKGVFFVHIMKTGGTTVTGFLREVFDDDAVYPPANDRVGSSSKFHPTHLLDLSVQERRHLKMYSVHMPAWVAEAVAPDFCTATVLREPVARTVSHLRQISGNEWAPNRLEEIWDAPEWRLRLVDYQTMHFAAERPDEQRSKEMKRASDEEFTSEQGRKRLSDALGPVYATAVPTPVSLGRSDLERAKRRLSQFDVVGLTEELTAAGARLARLIGVQAPTLRQGNRTTDMRPVSRSLLRRLERDLTLDLELYETARALSTNSAWK